MDKWMENRWFMRIVGLTLAFLLYMSVNYENITSGNNETNSNSDAELIQGVPLDAFYDRDNLVITGVPNTVDLSVSGPKAIVQSAKAMKDFQAYVDLKDIGIGTHRVNVQIQNISDKLDVTMNPGYITVNVQEKVSAEFPVEAEFNSKALAKGFEVDKINVNPKKVKITGSKKAIESISYVKATLDTKNSISDTFTQEAKVQVLDQDLNKLDVIVEPDTVEVQVQVVNPSKEVPININQTGQLPKGIKISSMKMEPELAKIYGTNEVLDSLKDITAEVDLSKIDKDQTIEVPLKLPEGVNKVEPEKVKLTFEVEEATEKTITGISLVPLGLGKNYDYTIVSPQDGIEVLLQGFKDDIDKISKDDFTLSVDLTGLEPGEHDVTITAEGPEDIDWSLSREKVKLKIIEKSSV